MTTASKDTRRHRNEDMGAANATDRSMATDPGPGGARLTMAGIDYLKAMIAGEASPPRSQRSCVRSG